MKISAVLKEVRTPKYRQRIVPAKKGTGSVYNRAKLKAKTWSN